MTPKDPNSYTLTVRPHRDQDGAYEYVLSRPGSNAVPSEVAYATYEAAKAAGDALGRRLGLQPATTSADR